MSQIILNLIQKAKRNGIIVEKPHGKLVEKSGEILLFEDEKYYYLYCPVLDDVTVAVQKRG